MRHETEAAIRVGTRVAVPGRDFLHHRLGFRLEQRVHQAITTRHPEDLTMTTQSRQTTAIPATRNQLWGYWGSMKDQANEAWPLAMAAIADATGESLESVRIFLDSRHGRHFADDVQNGLYRGQALQDAIAAAVRRWMGWKIGRQTSKDYGIPRGLPYLTGFVIHCEISEAAA